MKRTASLLLILLSVFLLGCGSVLTLQLGTPAAPKADPWGDDLVIWAMCAPAGAAQRDCAESHLVRIGVKPEEAARRILTASAKAHAIAAGAAVGGTR